MTPPTIITFYRAMFSALCVITLGFLLVIFFSFAIGFFNGTALLSEVFDHRLLPLPIYCIILFFLRKMILVPSTAARFNVVMLLVVSIIVALLYMISEGFATWRAFQFTNIQILVTIFIILSLYVQNDIKDFYENRVDENENTDFDSQNDV